MVISSDKKNLFIAVPKNGSSTASTVLRQFGSVVLDDRSYLTYTQCCNICNTDQIQKVYIFYRDPVSRFISHINFLRNIYKNNYLVRQRPEWFVGIDFSNHLELVATSSEPQPGPRKTKYAIKNYMSKPFLNLVQEAAYQITPEQIFNDREIFNFRPQSFWYQDIPREKLYVLDFNNFENNLKKVAHEFGATTEITLPKINDGNKITQKLSIELEARVKEYYNEDYTLLQNLYNPFN